VRKPSDKKVNNWRGSSEEGGTVEAFAVRKTSEE
jgi:hypothetical protein